MPAAYSDPLARIHADAYAPRLAPAYHWLLGLLREGIPRPRLFDMGCGDGQWLDYAARHGVKGAGCDPSPAFAARTRARGLPCTCTTAAEARIPPGTTTITALGEVLCYLSPDTGTDDLGPVLQKAAATLPPGGLLIADFTGPDMAPGDSTAEGPGWRLTSKVRIARGVLTRQIAWQADGARGEETHRQRLVAPGAVAEIARHNGLRPAFLESYGPLPLLPGRFAVKLEMP